MMGEDEEELNYPDMDEIALQVAVEAAAKMFKALQKQGLSIDEAATIVAAIMTRGLGYGKDNG